MENAKEKEQLFLFGMIVSMFCWGLTWTSGKILASYGNPVLITYIRFVITFVSLLILLVIARQPLSLKLEGTRDLLISSVFISIYYYFFFKGLIEGKAGAGGVLVTTLNPVISYIIMLIRSKRLPLKAEFFGLVTGIVAGIILLEFWKNYYSLFEEGNIYFLLASLSWSILSVFTARASRYGSPLPFSLWMYGICAVAFAIFAPFSETATIITSGDVTFWFNMIFSATITTSIATTFYFVATAKVGASKASSYIFMVPLSAALGAWFFIREIPAWNTIVGGILGIVAVILLNKKNSVSLENKKASQ